MMCRSPKKRRITAQSDVAPTLHRYAVLAGQHQLSFYDAAYLELAMRTGSELATLDRKLKGAATNSGVFCLSL